MSKAENALIALLSGLFFASGGSALVYQIGWQRLLFTAFGIDIESVTLVVAAFMLGLGAGALLGGYLADRYPQKTLFLFAASEAGVGLYGLLSPDIIRAAGERFVDAEKWHQASIDLMLLLFPTLLMGATLPILIARLSRISRNVGASTGTLYSANTLGSSIGALLTGFVLFYFFELDTVLRMAAVINLFVAVSVLVLFIAFEKK